jgi:hypothetical protein
MNNRDGGSAVLVAKSVELAEEIANIQLTIAIGVHSNDDVMLTLLMSRLEEAIEEHRVLVHGVSSGAEF